MFTVTAVLTDERVERTTGDRACDVPAHLRTVHLRGVRRGAVLQHEQ